MKLVISIALFLSILSFVSTALQATETQQKPTIYLDGPSSSSSALYVQSVLEHAYAQLGYKVEYLKMPLGRGYVEANEGRIDGLRTRINRAVVNYPNLIPVPVPLLEFNLVMLADRRKCGLCDIHGLNHVATTRGLTAFEEFRQKQNIDLQIEYVTSSHQAFDLVVAGKVDAAVINDANLPDKYNSLNHHLIKNILVTSEGYHFVHKKHRALVKPLQAQLQAMESSGKLKALRQKYGIAEPVIHKPVENFAEIISITAPWEGFTDSEDATYIQILKQIYQQKSTKLNNQLANWKRAKQLFINKRADILIGAYLFEKPDNVLSSDAHIDYEQPVIAYAKTEQALNLVTQGEQSATVCYLLGYDFKRFLANSIKPYEVYYMEDCMRMLSNDRIDVLLEYERHLSADFTSRYISKQVLEGLPLFIFFHDDARGRALKKVFEQRFRQLVMEDEVANKFPNQEAYVQAKLKVLEYQEVSYD